MIAAVVAAVTTVASGNASAYALIVLMASAMGVRNADRPPHRRAGPHDRPVLTMTLTGFAADSRLAGGSGTGSVRRLSAVLAMLVGAIAGALLLKASVFAPLGLAAVLAIATWLVYVPAAVRLGSNPE